MKIIGVDLFLLACCEMRSVKTDDTLGMPAFTFIGLCKYERLDCLPLVHELYDSTRLVMSQRILWCISKSKADEAGIRSQPPEIMLRYWTVRSPWKSENQTKCTDIKNYFILS